MTDDSHLSMEDVDALNLYNFSQILENEKYKREIRARRRISKEKADLRRYLNGKKYNWAELRCDQVFMDLYRKVEEKRRRQ